jgi:hypothetical protein
LPPPINCIDCPIASPKVCAFGVGVLRSLFTCVGADVTPRKSSGYYYDPVWPFDRTKRFKLNLSIFLKRSHLQLRTVTPTSPNNPNRKIALSSAFKSTLTKSPLPPEVKTTHSSLTVVIMDDDKKALNLASELAQTITYPLLRADYKVPDPLNRQRITWSPIPPKKKNNVGIKNVPDPLKKQSSSAIEDTVDELLMDLPLLLPNIPRKHQRDDCADTQQQQQHDDEHQQNVKKHKQQDEMTTHASPISITAPNKSIEQTLQQFIHHTSQTHYSTLTTSSQSEHRFQGRKLLLNLLQSAHEEVYRTKMKEDRREFTMIMKEMQLDLMERRKRVMEKLEFASMNTEGKVDSDATVGILQKIVMLLKSEGKVLEDSVRRLVDYCEREDDDDDDDGCFEKGMISLTDGAVIEKDYKLAGRVLQEDGDELENYEHC